MSRERRNCVLLVLLSLVGIGLLAVASSAGGAGLTPDSLDYLSAADHLVRGEGFVRYEGGPFVYWPPLYPSLLAFLRLIGIDFFTMTRWFNALLLGAIVFTAGSWFVRRVEDPIFVWLGTLGILCGVPLMAVGVFVWSELLFIFFLLLFLITLITYLERTEDRRGLFVGMIVTAGLACLTRYIGVAVVMTGGLLLLIYGRTSIKRRIYKAVTFGVLSVLPLGLWFVRNFYFYGTISGERLASDFTLSENILMAINALSKWIFPLTIPAETRILFVCVGMIFVLGLILLGVKRLKQDGKGSRALLPVIVPGTFVLFYTALLVTLATRNHFDDIALRLMSPVFVPLVMMVVVLFSRARFWISGARFGQCVRAGVIFLMGVWIFYSATASALIVKAGTEGQFGNYLWPDFHSTCVD